MGGRGVFVATNMVGVIVALGDAVGLGVFVAVGVNVGVSVLVGVRVGVLVGVRVLVGVEVAVALIVAVGAFVKVGVGDFVGVNVLVAVTLGGSVTVGVSVAVGLVVTVGDDPKTGHNCVSLPVLVSPQLLTTVTSHLYVFPGTGVKDTDLAVDEVVPSFRTELLDVSVILYSYMDAPLTASHEHVAILLQTGGVSEITCWVGRWVRKIR